MSVLSRSAIAVPENVITAEQTLELAARLYVDHPRLELALRLIKNAGVRKRHLASPPR